MNNFIIWLTLPIGVLLGLAKGTTQEFPKTTVQPLGGAFELEITRGTPGVDVLIGVRPSSTVENAVALRVGMAGGAPRLSSAPMKVSAGKLEVAAQSEPVLVLISLHDGVQLTITQDGQRVSMPVRGSSVVRNGVARATSEPVTMARLLKESLEPGSEIRALSGAEYQVPAKVLRDQALRLVIPKVAAGGTPCCTGGEGLVTAMITIDEAGRVADVVRHFGEATHYAACETAIRQWEFRPLIVSGKAVRMKSVIHFRLQPDGTLALISK